MVDELLSVHETDMDTAVGEVPDDCFAEQIKGRLWILAIVIIVIFMFSIVAITTGKSAASPVPLSAVRARAAAFNPGPPPVSQNRAVIRELAMEVNTLVQQQAVLVHSVYGGGWAEKGGFRIGDVIFRFNGRRARNIDEFRGLIARAMPESPVMVQVIRNGRRITLMVMVGEGEMEGVTIPNAAPVAWSGGGQGSWLYRNQ